MLPGAPEGPPEIVIPRPTVREAMTFGGMAAATLVAGESGLERQIEWVRVMETPETVQRMRRNELLLTTAYPIREDPEAQVRQGGGEFATYVTADPEWQRLYSEMVAHAGRDKRFRAALVARR